MARCAKGHSPQEMAASNYGMPAPAGYRTALRLFRLAERFQLPVVTLIDTCGAWPSFEVCVCVCVQLSIPAS
jgi:acetyl-CoA carboxylase alpha subunit